MNRNQTNRTKPMKKQFRQGDVLLERIDKLPKNLKPVSHEKGFVVLAHGEVTGHAHTIACEEAEKFLDTAGGEFFHIKGRPIHGRFPILRRWRGQVLVKLPTCTAEFSVDDVEIDNDQASVAGDFGLLAHQEHNVQALLAGTYKGGSANGTVRQREYSPEAIRNVAD
jgi:hypothetical protein